MVGHQFKNREIKWRRGWLVSRRPWRIERSGKKLRQTEKGIKSRNNFMHPIISATIRENQFVIECNWIKNYLLYECYYNNFNSFVLLNKIRNFCYQDFAIIMHSIWSHILSCLPLSTLPTMHNSVPITC